MGRKHLIVVVLLVCWIAALSWHSRKGRYLTVEVPKGWPQPQAAVRKTKISEEGFILGRTLFNDPILSKDNTISCASCHLNFTAFTHADHALSHGIYGLKGTRNSPSLMNLAWSPYFMWDGRVTTLESQPVNPITNAVEMASEMSGVVDKLNRNAEYRASFYTVFGDSIASEKTLLSALQQFTLMLVSCNSKYDSVSRGDEGVHFTASELNGYNLFQQHCAACHKEPLFTNYSFANNGLPIDTALKDFGRIMITAQPEDSLKFKVPTLRNIAVSGPYMHDGRFPRLKDVIAHYTGGIVHSATLAPELGSPITLTPTEKKDLISFLNTLTDKAFLYEIKFRAEGH